MTDSNMKYSINNKQHHQQTKTNNPLRTTPQALGVMYLVTLS